MHIEGYKCGYQIRWLPGAAWYGSVFVMRHRNLHCPAIIDGNQLLEPTPPHTIECVACSGAYSIQRYSAYKQVTHLTDALMISDVYLVSSLNICICKRITLFFIPQRIDTKKCVVW